MSGAVSPEQPGPSDEAARPDGRPIRVVIVDDQALMRTGFRLILDAEDDLEVVGEADNGTDAVSQCRRLRPDVVLMDIRMPGLDGVEATRQLLDTADADAPRVLMLTTFDRDEYVYASIRAGASGFLLKDVPPEQLVDAIRILATGEALLAPSITRRLLAEFATRPAGTGPPPALDDLTAREREVLLLVASGLSNAEIAAHLTLGHNTVKTHVGHVLTKLQLRDRVQAVVFAYETGLLTPGR
jgi:DNA-binding NarL/FixJ family response regulator